MFTSCSTIFFLLNIIVIISNKTTMATLQDASTTRKEYHPSDVSEGCKYWLELINKKIIKQKSTNPNGTSFAFPSRLHEDMPPYVKCMAELKRTLRSKGYTTYECYLYDHGQPSQSTVSLRIAWRPSLSERYYDFKDNWLGSIQDL